MLNEGETKRRNKAKKNKLVRANFPQGQASDDTTPAENPHGTNSMGSEEIGHKRGGKKAKGVKAPSPGKLARVVKRTKSKEGKRRRAKEVMSKNTAGPVGRLPDHTVYHDMGMLMAESLGLISEKTRMAKEVQKKGPEHRFATAGGESLRGGSLVRKASTEAGGSQHPKNNARDEYGRTGRDRGQAAARLRQPGERAARVSDKKLARGLSTKGTNPSAREGTPGGNLQAKMKKKNFNPMSTRVKRTNAKAKKIEAERAEGKAGKRDK